MMIKLLILIVILACIGPFFIKGPDGQPLATLEDWKMDLPDSPMDLLPDSAQESVPDVPEVTEVTEVYRWQDENGVWQFSNNPNDAPGAEVMALDGKINIIESAQLPPTSSPDTRKSIPSSIPSVATVAPGQAAELMETVTNLQDTIDQRKADMDTISGMKR